MHTALFAAIWLFSVVVYAVAIAGNVETVWLIIDLLLIGLAIGLVYRRREVLGFGSLGRRKGPKLVAITLIGTLCVLACQLVIADWHMVALDETHYLLTLREGRIIPDGLLPFNIRWLVPFFGGPWNFLPVADMDAIKAINFGAFVVTGVGLVLLLVRLRVPLWLAIASPIFLLCSYLGIYGASNRLVLDPANYALFVIMFHTLLRREHWPLFAIALFVDALNAEKAVYWIPVFVLVTLFRYELPWKKKDLLEVAKISLFALGPTLLYLLALTLYLAPSRLEANLCFENLHAMSFSSLGGKMTENVRNNGMQMLWFPFGPFTIYALLGFALSGMREIKPIVLLLLPIFTQALIACDTARMLAYAFIVYLPFGYLYLARAYTDMPRALAVTLFTLSVVLVVIEHYLFPISKALGAPLGSANRIKMWLSAFEILLVGGIVFLHFSFFRRTDPKPS